MNAIKLTAIFALALSPAIAPLRAADCCCLKQAPAAHPGSVAILLGLDSVRRELKLSPAQAARLDAIRADFKTGARKLTAQAPGTPVARKSAWYSLANLKNKADANALAVLTPEQRSRLVQIEHQILGGTMLLLPSVQKAIGLSPAQIAKIGRLQQNGLKYAGALNRRFEDGKISHHERLALLRAHRIKQAGAMVRLLTPSQRQALNALRGKPLPKK